MGLRLAVMELPIAAMRLPSVTAEHPCAQVEHRAGRLAVLWSMDAPNAHEEACPVCFYAGSYELWDICECCGTEFGFDDWNTTHDELRRRWIEGGCVWWSSTTPPPDWDPHAQLKRRT